MIIDAELQFCKDQVVTATAASAKRVDLQVEGDAIGQELTFHAVVSKTFTHITSLSVTVQTSSDDSTWVAAITGPVVAKARLVKGASALTVRVPQGLSRYVRLYFTVVGNSGSEVGSITAFASKDL